ncbi:MAG: hypothetical protein H6Q89_5426, partial [Myxococcaceae bacterium]|nr:hypothetical protein [Myxococcaceae bacterium]
MRRFISVAVLGLAACRQPGLQETSRTLHLSPGVADFGSVYPGQSKGFRLTLRNDGPPAQLKWTAPEAPFGLSEDLPTEAPSGEV